MQGNSFRLRGGPETSIPRGLTPSKRPNVPVTSEWTAGIALYTGGGPWWNIKRDASASFSPLCLFGVISVYAVENGTGRHRNAKTGITE